MNSHFTSPFIQLELASHSIHAPFQQLNPFLTAHLNWDMKDGKRRFNMPKSIRWRENESHMILSAIAIDSDYKFIRFTSHNIVDFRHSNFIT
jgi:hypothetical protein